jgi:hypothetical protein
VAGLSMLSHFQSAQRGVLEIPALFYFVSLIGLFTAFTVLAADTRRGG